jgi:RNA polymerase sigma-70 factor (ECF subfamily)
VKIEKATVDSLISGFYNGSRDDFDALYRYTREFLYIYALTVVGDSYIADDAVQDAFIRVYRYINKYRPGTNGLAWLIQITKNTAINAKNNREKVVIVDETRQKSPVYDPGTIAEDRLYVDYMLKKLTEGERQVVMLHLFGELAVREVAEILGVPVTTAEWRYKSALKKLKKAIDSSN